MKNTNLSVALVVVLNAACGAAENVIEDVDDTREPTDVNVSLREFSIDPSPAFAPAGTVRFHVTNDGEEQHEFLVIRTELAPNALPRAANGSYQENGEGTELLDEIEMVMPGETRELELDLNEGGHVLICNMVEIEDDIVEAHYAKGMYAAFDVGPPDVDDDDNDGDDDDDDDDDDDGFPY
jgi:uncharacterized cupredoxin-like copper-binding protein